MAYLRVEKPRFLFLEGSAGPEAAASAATVAPLDASAARAGTSAVCASSSVDRPAAGAPASAPGTCCSTASATLGEGGADSHLSGEACPSSLSSSSSSPDDEYSGVAGGESPCCSRSRNSSSLYSRRSRHRILFSFFRAARSCSPRCAARVRPSSGCGRVRPRSVHSHPLLGRTKRQSRGGTWQRDEGKGEESTHQLAVGKHDERLEVVVAGLDRLEVDGAPRPCGPVLLGETVG
jgi:hypothetical protein